MWSKITFSWVSPIIDLCQTQQIKKSDIENAVLTTNVNVKKSVDRMRKAWENELQKSPLKPSLMRVVLIFIGKRRFMLLTLSLFIFYFSIIAYCVCIRELLLFLDGSHTISSSTAYFYCVLLFLFSIYRSIHWCLFSYITKSVYYTETRAALIGLLFEKAMRISNNSIESSKVVNLMTNDLEKFQRLWMYLSVSVVSPIAFVISLIYFSLSLNNGFIMLGLPIMLVLCPLQIIFAPFLKKFKQSIMQNADKRLKLIKEATIGYLSTKMYCWEEPVYNLVANAREKEIEAYIKRAIVKSWNRALFSLSPMIYIAFTFVPQYYATGQFDSYQVYTMMVFYWAVYIYVTYLPLSLLHSFVELRVGTKRIVDFLLCSEVNNYRTLKHSNNAKNSVTITNGSFSWNFIEKIQLLPDKQSKMAKNDKNKDIEYIVLNSEDEHKLVDYDDDESNTLSNVNLKIESNKLVAIVGRVGSGKSSLLSALLGDIPQIDMNARIDNDTVLINGKIGYCSQRPWIFTDSIRNNILFGNEYNEQWYNQVIYACCLKQDIDSFPDSDLTMIGERGLNLSGGQKVRINLARSVYCKPDVLLLDDPLSSVDSIVANNIFERLLNSKNGLMKNTIRLVVMNQLQYLSLVDQIIWLQNGHIKNTQNNDNKDNQSVKPPSFLQFDDCDAKLNDNIDNDMEANEFDFDATGKSILEEEKRQTGSVPFAVYMEFISPFFLKVFCIFTLMVIPNVVQLAAVFWLGWWGQDTFSMDSSIYANTFLLLVLFCFACYIIKSIGVFWLLYKDALRLHNKMFKAVLWSSVRFFESNPVGRILNRFSKDQMCIDESLIESIDVCGLIFATILMNIPVIIILEPMFFLFIIPMFLVMVWICNKYLKASRCCRRLEATTNSPILSYFSDCYYGNVIVRSMNEQQFVFDKVHKMIDLNVKTALIADAVGVWLMFRLDVLVSTVTLFIACGCVYSVGHVSEVTAAIILVQMTKTMSSLSTGCRYYSQLENDMVSAERIVEWANLKSESSEFGIDPNIVDPCDDWPRSGAIEIENLSVSYRKDLDDVLKNINLSIGHGEKIGIVGRTGGGKSTFFLTLFRLLNYKKGGNIKIDGISIENMSLKKLRSSLFIIPQNCILFSETLRYNLDPFCEYSDEEIMGVLRELGLNNQISLYALMGEYGSNLSVGQSQLLCVARAMLNSSSHDILLIDEATANVDNVTDSIIQNVFKQKLFKNKTVLTIAHRIETVIDYDKIIVLDKGNVVEFDEPTNLINDKNSTFFKLYAQSKSIQ